MPDDRGTARPDRRRPPDRPPRAGPQARGGISPILGPKGEIAQDQAADRPPAVSSKTLIDMVTRTIELGRHIQGMAGRWRDRFNELSTRLEQQMSRPSPERDAPVANRDRPGGTLRGQHREGAGEEESLQCRAAGGGEHVAPRPLPTAAPPAVDAPEGLNGYRPKRNSYPQVRRRIREVVNAELPTGSVVVVVSRGDDNLLQLGPRRGWHFPQTEAGVYAGCYPADSREAIAHLEEIRAREGITCCSPVRRSGGWASTGISRSIWNPTTLASVATRVASSSNSPPRPAVTIGEVERGTMSHLSDRRDVYQDSHRSSRTGSGCAARTVLRAVGRLRPIRSRLGGHYRERFAGG